MKAIHLWAGLIPLLSVALALFTGVRYAQSVETQYIHALAPRHAALNATGSALQAAAFQQPDLLMVYGASEVTYQPSRYQAATFFQTYPTGFETYEVSRFGMNMIVVAEALAALGPEVRGKKVVISYTPSQFTSTMNPADYAGFFSRLHANQFAFSLYLSWDTKQMLARRMLHYPRTLEKDRLLRFALEQLANGTPLGHMLYAAAWPLGKLQTLVIELQDHFATVTFIRSQKNLSPAVRRTPAAINWQSLEAQADTEQMAHANNNSYGFDSAIWTRRFTGFKIEAANSGDKSYVANLNKSAEWTDYELVLRILKELGAEPLVLGRPLPAAYYDAIGISQTARQVFYDRLHQTADRYGVPVVDLRDHEYDKYFAIDPEPHTSREGWVYVDQYLDAFYHGTYPSSVDQGSCFSPLLPGYLDRLDLAVRQRRLFNTELCVPGFLR
jgi:D-alanine transfer protein